SRLAVPAGECVDGHGRIAVTDVRHVARIVDRRRDVERTARSHATSLLSRDAMADRVTIRPDSGLPVPPNVTNAEIMPPVTPQGFAISRDPVDPTASAGATSISVRSAPCPAEAGRAIGTDHCRIW